MAVGGNFLSGCLTQLRASVNFPRVFFRLGMVPCDTRGMLGQLGATIVGFFVVLHPINSWPFLKRLATNRHQRFAKIISARLVSST